MKIGILHTQSSLYPLATYDFADGVELAFAAHFPDMPIEIITEDVQKGTDTTIIQEKGLKLFAQHKCKAIFTLAENNPNLALLEQITESMPRPIVLSGWGGILGIKQHGTNPYLYQNSLDICESAFLTGQYMASRFQNILVVSSVYEGGYQMTYSFYEGMASVSPKAPSIYVIPDKQDDEGIQNFVQVYEERQFDAIFAIMSHRDAEKFAGIYANLLATKAPIFVTYPFAQKLFTNPNLPAPQEIYYISSLNQYTQTAENEHFTKQCQEKEINPSEYTLLGYESGQLAANLLSKGKMENQAIHSLRQNVHYLANTQRTQAAHILYKSTKQATQYVHEVIHEFPLANVIDNLVEGAKEKTFSQWLNPYLFV